MNIVPQQLEMFAASQFAESLGGSLRLMEIIIERRNMFKALKRVRANKGAPGVDGITVNQLGGYLKRHQPKIREDLLNSKYNPFPVRSKEIDKPDGGVRLLDIPTVLDRLIQQATAQIVEQIWDPTFSEFSYGFRPGRSQRDAVLQAKSYLLDGYKYVIDMDLSKFFDRVNHDRLMSRLAIKIQDKRVLKLIRRYLTAGTMINGVINYSDEGTPQGWPLSPLLSNIVLDELDKELEKSRREIKKYIAELSKIRGFGTELISLYIPPNYPIGDVSAKLRTEYSQASNIKSKTTRKNVLGALERLINFLKHFNKPPDNGIAIFSGNVSTNPGESDIQLVAIKK